VRKKPYQAGTDATRHHFHSWAEGFELICHAPRPTKTCRSAQALRNFTADMADEHGEDLSFARLAPTDKSGTCFWIWMQTCNNKIACGSYGRSVHPGKRQRLCGGPIFTNDPHAAENVSPQAGMSGGIGLVLRKQILCTFHSIWKDIALGAPGMAAFLRDVSAFYVRCLSGQPARYDALLPADPAAVICHKPNPGIGYSFIETAPVKVVLDGEGAGDTQIVETPSRPNVRFATACKHEEIRDQLPLQPLKAPISVSLSADRALQFFSVYEFLAGTITVGRPRKGIHRQNSWCFPGQTNIVPKTVAQAWRSMYREVAKPRACIGSTTLGPQAVLQSQPLPTARVMAPSDRNRKTTSNGQYWRNGNRSVA